MEKITQDVRVLFEQLSPGFLSSKDKFDKAMETIKELHSHMDVHSQDLLKEVESVVTSFTSKRLMNESMMKSANYLL